VSTFVADSSLAIAWFVPSQRTDDTDALLSSIEGGTSFVVPLLWTFEVANVLLTLSRRQRLKVDQYQFARRNLANLRPVVDQEGATRALNIIIDLAEKHSLSVYEATYLEVAMRMGLPLASRDKALNKAAKASGVSALL